MYRFPIGVILESFRTDTKTAIEKAAALGADGIFRCATENISETVATIFR